MDEVAALRYSKRRSDGKTEEGRLRWELRVGGNGGLSEWITGEDG